VKNKRNSLLATLGSMALGAAALSSQASAADYVARCDQICNMTDVAALSLIAKNHQDACSALALKRIVDLTQPASRPISEMACPPLTTTYLDIS
jgi:hypothetical protein